jgi:hypothetical protein
MHMSRARQTLLSRIAFSALVAASLTFGGVQALSGSAKYECSSGYTCATRPQDSGCAARCLQLFPENLGTHFCNSQFCCVCAE